MSIRKQRSKALSVDRSRTHVFVRCSLWITCILFGVALLAFAPFSQSSPAAEEGDGKDQRVELGKVDWHEGLTKARKKAENTGRPIFLLFTEVPGCSTVKGYGRNVLAHPQVSDAIEAAFVPAVVYNNQEGKHRKLLNSFGEPTWNNPAVRIIRSERSMLAQRLYGDYSVGATVRTMVRALIEADREVPSYLELLDRRYNSGSTDTAAFSMYCYWSGEAEIGRLPSVRSTRPGFIAGGEGVQVIFDPERSSLAELADKVISSGAADHFHARTEEQLRKVRSELSGSRVSHDPTARFRYKASSDDHYLQGSAYSELELHEIQKTRVNSALGLGKDPDPFLSPGQRREIP